MTGMDQATTKGSILSSLRKFVEDDLSAEQYEIAIRALPPADQQIVRPRAVLASDKVSEFVLNRLTVEAARAKGESVEAFGRRAGTAELKATVGIYRFFTLVLTPAALIKKASTLWSTVHSHGSLTVLEQADGLARVRLASFPSEEAHCARFTGWIDGLGPMTGVRNMRVVHDVCAARGDASCEWLVTWGKK
jgi:hypothetical protein